MLIWRMGQQACCNWFCLWGCSISHLCIFATNYKVHYPKCKTKYHWHCIDTHFQNGAGSMVYCFWVERWSILHLWMFASNRLLGYQDPSPKMIDILLTLILRMGQWLCGLLFCQDRLPVCQLWIAATKSFIDYWTYTTMNRWRSTAAHFNLRSNQDLLLLIIVFIINWS